MYPSILCDALGIFSSRRKIADKPSLLKNHSTFKIQNDLLNFDVQIRDRIISITDAAHSFDTKEDLSKSRTSKSYTFMEFDMFLKEDSKYQVLKVRENWEWMMNTLKKRATRNKNDLRECTMYSYGSTRGPTNWPRFEFSPGCYDSLPRPYPTSKPGQKIHQELFDCVWFKDLVRTVEDLTLYYLTHFAKNRQYPEDLHALYAYHRSKKIIPNSLRICGSVFTNLTITTNSRGEAVKPHMDEDDIMTAVLHIGDVTKGGETEYYHGHSEVKKQLKHRAHLIPFKHGKLQLGYFHKVNHGVRKWSAKESRYALNFIMKKSVYDHFDDYGDIFYNQLVDRGYYAPGLVAQLPRGFKFNEDR